ncbi:MAG: hypothetical protein II070_11295 [Treponema sp.]|nr:hypothetical protein [Treponema sp.]MBQ2481756.1 hypothetical protein [Treponema sp.]
MLNRRLFLIAIILFVNCFTFGREKIIMIEKLALGTSRADVSKEFGEPDSYEFDTNKVKVIYKISGSEYYKLYFTYTQKLWKLSKFVDDEEYIIFMDTRIQ